MKKKLDIQPNLSIVNKCTNSASVLGLQYFEVPLYMFICLCFFYVVGIQLMKTEQQGSPLYPFPSTVEPQFKKPLCSLDINPWYSKHYLSFKIFLFFCLAQIPWKILHNQLVVTPFVRGMQYLVLVFTKSMNSDFRTF